MSRALSRAYACSRNGIGAANVKQRARATGTRLKMRTSGLGVFGRVSNVLGDHRL